MRRGIAVTEATGPPRQCVLRDPTRRTRGCECMLRTTMTDRKIRILVAKPGLDGHDRGAKVIASAFRDAGYEVVYTGLHQTPEMIANAAVQEDVDVVALSILSGAHMTLFPRVLELLREQGADHILVIGGGIMPEEDIAALESMGVAKLFGPGTPTSAPIDFVREYFSQNAVGR